MKALKLTLAALPALLAIQAQAQFCNNDDDCACGQVCSYAGVAQTCVTAGTDPGWCSAGLPNNGGCMYAGQICCNPYCYPAWTPDAGCLKQPDGGLETSSNTGVSCPTGGSTGGASSTTAASGSTTGGGSGSGSVVASSSIAESSSGGSKSFAPSSTSAATEAGASTGGSSAGHSSSTSGGGGCTQVPGELTFAALLAVGLLARSRRRRG